MKIKPLPTTTELSESIKWNLSGSTFMHIVAVLGVSFYSSNSALQQSDPVIKVKLNSDTQLSSSVQTDQTLQSFNYSMDMSIQDSETQAVSDLVESPTANTQIVESNSSQLDKIAKELERLRKQQAELVKDLRKGQKKIENEAREVFTTSYSNDNEFNDYKESWRQHVETYGNTHYPQQISNNAISGSLILDAVIRSDGALLRVDIVKSSGNALLDQAAIDIVNAAAPYPALPPDTKDNVLMHIIRTWQFKHNSVSSAAY